MRRFTVLLVLVVGWASVGDTSADDAKQPMTFDQALEQLKTYDFGQDDKALHVIQLHVVRTATDPARKAEVAAQLAKALAEPKVSQAAKTFVCQQLFVVGGEAQVPLLAKMLDDPQTAEIARHTLEAIPGEASLAALRGCLGKLKGMPLVGAINSLGIRRDIQSVTALSGLLGSPDPLVAGAAAEALGKIATPEAAAALMKATLPAKAQGTLHNARLQCAERLAASGDAATAAGICQQIWSSDLPAARRIGALAGLARFSKDKAAPAVLEALGSRDPLVQATAVRIARGLPGAELTAALVARLEKLDAAAQVLLLDVLAERGDRTAGPAVARLIESKAPAIQMAAILALGRLGDVAMVEPLVRLAVAGGGPGGAARTSLARLQGEDVDKRLLAMAPRGEPKARVEAIRALAARGHRPAVSALLQTATDADASVRIAALDALAVLCPCQGYPALVKLLVEAKTPEDTAAAQAAVLAVGSRDDDEEHRLGTITSALSAAPVAAKAALVRVLGQLGGQKALEAIRARLGDKDKAVRDAAVRALAAWSDASAATDLLKLAQAAEQPTHRVLALRGYLRLAGETKDAGARLKLLEQVRPIATTAAAKRMLLSGLAEAADSGALHVAAGLLDDAEVHAEAAAAVLKIGRALVRIDPPDVRAAMKKLADTSKDKAVTDEAAALDKEALKAPSPAAAQQALQYDKKRSDAQKAALAKRAPPGFHLACYLDCGPDTADGVRGGPTLRLVAGAPYSWPESVQAADLRFGTVFYDAQRVTFEAAGLNPKKSYQLGFSWWDCDHDTREQSVLVATGKGERETQVLGKTKLPSGPGKQGPEVKTVPVPRQLHADGSLRIGFRNESEPNVVVSELWLWESDADGPVASGAKSN